MFQTFISRHNSNFFSDKLVLTSVTPASSAPVLQTPKATSSTLYFDSLTVNAGNGGFLHCIQMDTNKVWIATDRSRARRCVEACVYGTLDFVGYPRFPAPVEFIAAVIAYYVHPVNI